MRAIIILLFILLILVNSVERFTDKPERLPYIKLQQPSDDVTEIPMIIHRTWDTQYIKTSMFKRCHLKWLELNPSYIQTWSSKNARVSFLSKLDPSVLEAYDKLIPGAYKADLWRLCVLYVYGGVYVDGQTSPYQSLDYIFKDCFKTECKHKLVTALDPKKAGGGIHNGFIACTPKHPYILQYIKDLIENVVNEEYTDHTLGVTGPRLFAKSVRKVIGRDVEFKRGHNDHELPFYLLWLEWGLFQYIYKGDTIVMTKKYNTFDYVYGKITNKSGYNRLWYNRAIFKTQSKKII